MLNNCVLMRSKLSGIDVIVKAISEENNFRVLKFLLPRMNLN